MKLTTALLPITNKLKLWFAFRLYLRDEAHNPNTLCIGFKELWFAFRLYLRDEAHNQTKYINGTDIVVICFQIVSSWWSSQQHTLTGTPETCCDLLSDCIFVMKLTTRYPEMVVHTSCDLLSDCIFVMKLTTNCLNNATMPQLWFAFRLYLRDEAHNICGTVCFKAIVVICFQIVSSWWSSQRLLCVVLNIAVVICFQIVSSWWSSQPEMRHYTD